MRYLLPLLFIVLCAGCENPLKSSSDSSQPIAQEESDPLTLPGNEGGNGGNEIGLEFIAAANRAIHEIEKDPELFNEVTASQLRETLKKISIIVVESPLIVTLNGIHQESVAQNSVGRPIILVNRFRWMSVPSEHLQEGIALHEVLGVMNLESTGSYPISSRYLEKFHLEESDLTQDHATRETLIVCSDHNRSFFSLTGWGLSDLSIKITPIAQSEKEKLISFLTSIATPNSEHAVSLTFRLSAHMCAIDIKDRSLINCNLEAGKTTRAMLVNIELDSGEIQQIWLPDLRFHVFRASHIPDYATSFNSVFPAETQVRFGSEGTNIIRLGTVVEPPYRGHAGREAPTPMATLSLPFDSQSCR